MGKTDPTRPRASVRTFRVTWRVFADGGRGLNVDRWQVLLAQQGDRAALETLLKGVEARLYRYVSRTVGDPEAAKDVLQETFVRIYRGLRWLHDPDLFVAWSYRIATREAFRFLRRNRRWRESGTDLEEIHALPAASEPTGGLWQTDMEALLSLLSPASRAVLALRYLHDMPLDEIAAVLGIPLGTVKSRLAYGLRRLREEMSR